MWGHISHDCHNPLCLNAEHISVIRSQTNIWQKTICVQFGPQECQQCQVHRTICDTFGHPEDHTRCLLKGTEAAHQQLLQTLQPWNEAVLAKQRGDTTGFQKYDLWRKDNEKDTGSRRSSEKNKQLQRCGVAQVKKLLNNLKYEENKSTGCWKVLSSMDTNVSISVRDGYSHVNASEYGLHNMRTIRLQMFAHCDKVCIYSCIDLFIYTIDLIHMFTGRTQLALRHRSL